MKVRNLMMLLFMGAAVSSFGQKKHFTSSKATDNVFVSATGGASCMYTGSDVKFGKVRPHVTLSLGKWINPVWGVRGQVGAWDASIQVGDEYITKKTGALRADLLFNMSNAIWGYNPDRLFTATVFAGPGLNFAKRDVQNGDDAWFKKAMPNVSAGLIAKFNVCKYVDIDIEGRTELASNYFGAPNASQRILGLYAGAGVTYYFGGKDVTPFVEQKAYDEMNANVNEMRRDLDQATADLAVANEKIANFKPVVETIVEKEVLVGPRAVFFRIGSSRLDDFGKVNLKLVADIIKNNPEMSFTIAGYADKATGSARYNQRLSDKRAQAVKAELLKQGVSESQLKVASYGGTQNMFGKNKLNRVVILGE